MPMSPAFARLADARLVAVVCADRPELAVRVAKALLDVGLAIIEFTFTTPGAAEALAAVRATYGERVVLGAGTIREPAQVDAAVRVGADFLVTAHLRPDLLAAMLATSLPVAPSVFTPSEVARALDAGAEVVKLFPASTGGPAHLKALRGPFSELRIIPTGGIDLANATSWLAAGALAVGGGGELLSRALMRDVRWDEITERTRRFVAATGAAGDAF